MHQLRRALLATIALATPQAHAADPTPAAPTIRLGTEATLNLPELDIVTRRLDQARSQIQPNLGATRYEFGRQSIEALPQADNAPLNQLLLQAPGVAQDSFGQIHIRGDHNEIQFRLDGVQLPEGLSVFGQALQTRFAHSVSLITGSLPAQYGFRQAAIIDITTKSGTTDPGGEISIYGGARDLFQPSLSYGGRVGAIDYFLTTDILHTRVGIENPTPRFNAIHDQSNQYHGLIHVAGILDPTTRISLVAGSSNDYFQIPNNPGQSPTLGLAVNGTTAFDSTRLNQHQRELTDFAILSLQKQVGALDVQLSAFSRYTSLYYSPDPVGDLLFNGLSQTAARSVWSTGVQSDASWRLNDSHTLRAGLQIIGERTVAKSASQILLTGDSGAPLSDTPATIRDSSGKNGALYGTYIQDEWRLTPRLTINAGLRFDVVDQFTHENQLSPRLNAVWRPTDTTTLHAGYSRYFTPPPFELVSGTTLGRLANTTAAPQITRNDTVRSERDNVYDAGLTQILLPGLTVGLDAYYKSARNLIDEGQFGAPNILTAFNYARGQVSGVEATASYDRGPLSLYANLAYSRAIGRGIVSSQFNVSPQDLAYIASRYVHLDHDQRYTGSGGVAYTLFKDTPSPARLSADLVIGSGLRAGTDTVPNGRALPGYTTVNLSAQQTIDAGLVHGLQLRLDVINLLERRYELRDGTGIGVGAPQYGLRRTILAGLAQRF